MVEHTVTEKKQLLRAEMKNLRRSLPLTKKDDMDSAIFENLQKLFAESKENTIFTYVSGNIEVDTCRVILYSLKVGKRVAVPRCVDRNGKMDFYYITSMQQLEEGAFGILEPRTESCEKVLDYSRGICLVPGLSFDHNGFRLGYGKGFYDRFLSEFHGLSVGLCYEDCIRPSLPVHPLDRQVDILVTEKNICHLHDKTR